MWQQIINAFPKWFTKIKNFFSKQVINTLPKWCKNLLFKNKPPVQEKESQRVSEYTTTKAPEYGSEPPSSKPPNKKKVSPPFANARGENTLFTKGVLFEDPQPEINPLQKKVLEILFSVFNLSIKEDDIYVAYFPSRLLYYIEKQDSFSAFRRFLNDIGRTPDEVFKNPKTATFTKEMILGLYEADINCWDTGISTEPLYQHLRETAGNVDYNLDSFTILLERIEKLAILIHQLQRIAGQIPFNSFRKFSQEVNSSLKYWHTLSETTFDKWTNSLNEYKSQFKEYQYFSDVIDEDCFRLRNTMVVIPQDIINVIENLLKEVEQLKEKLKIGSISINEGLGELGTLASEIKGFVDEVLHRNQETKSSRKEDFAYTSNTLSVKEACGLLNLTIETISIKLLKAARNKYARHHHPDMGGDVNMMKRINEAYEILKDYLENRHT